MLEGCPSRPAAMEINHPVPQHLTPEEGALLEHFRERLRERLSSGGLTANDIRRIVAGIRSHPHVSAAVLKVIHEEASEQLPGGRLLTFDWD